MILYNDFFKRICVRKKEHVYSPRFFALAEFELPRGALYHYIPTELTEYGIDQNDLLVNRYSGDIYINHIPSLDVVMGNPMHKTLSLQGMIKRYHNTHRRFKLVRNIAGVMRNKLHLVVNDYAIAQHFLVYRPALFANYYRWYNMMYSVVKNMTELQGETSRPQFLYLQLPGTLPQLNQLRIFDQRLAKGLDKVQSSGIEDFGEEDVDAMLPVLCGSLEAFQDELVCQLEASNRDSGIVDELSCLHTAASMINELTKGEVKINQDCRTLSEIHTSLASGLEELKAFESKVMRFKPELNTATMNRLRTPNDYWFIHFWQWLGMNREASLFSMLDHDPKKLANIHLVIGNMGAYTVLRMDLLDEWRNEVLKRSKNKQQGLEAYRKHILKMSTKLFEVKTGGQDISEETEQQQEVFTGAIAQDDGDKSGENDNGKNVDTTSTNDDTSIPTATTTLFGMDLPTVEPDAPEATQEPKPGSEAEEPVDEVDRYEERDFTDDIPDDEFNHDRESRTASETVLVDEPPKPEDGINAYIERLADMGMLSAAEYKRFKQLSENYKNIPNPVGDGTLGDLMTIDPSVVTDVKGNEIPDSPSIIDKGMLSSTLDNFDARYISEVLESDIANAVLGIQAAGVAVIDYQREEVTDAVSSYVVYSVQVQPVGGKVTTIRFRIPKIEPDGTYTYNGVKSRITKQRADIPIRKVSATRVSMTSYYGKLFMNRSGESRYNYANWLVNRITLMSMRSEDGIEPEITDAVLGRNINTKLDLPHLFTVVAERYTSFTYHDHSFMFDLRQTRNKLGDETVDRWLKEKLVPCGTTGDGSVMLMDRDGTLYAVHGDTLETIADFESLLGLDVSKAPVEVAQLEVFRKAIPVGVIMAYYYGLTNMLELLSMQVRFVNRGERLNLRPDERTIAFNDEVLIYSRSDRFVGMLLGGFDKFSKELSRFSRYDFDRKSVYLGLLTSIGLGVRWIRELDLMREMFIDPITMGELQRIKAPVKFDLLLIHAVRMLLTSKHLSETSMREQRVRGYERVAGAVYANMVRTARIQKTRATTSKSGAEMHPEAVWYDITGDTATCPVEECNPVHNVKERENITYGGSGGRSSRSVTKPNRAYNEDNVGVISESSVDNGDAGYRGYLSSDPLITDLRGNTQAATEDTNPAQMMSTTALLYPGVDRDDKQLSYYQVTGGGFPFNC